MLAFILFLLPALKGTNSAHSGLEHDPCDALAFI